MTEPQPRTTTTVTGSTHYGWKCLGDILLVLSAVRICMYMVYPWPFNYFKDTLIQDDDELVRLSKIALQGHIQVGTILETNSTDHPKQLMHFDLTINRLYEDEGFTLSTFRREHYGSNENKTSQWQMKVRADLKSYVEAKIHKSSIEIKNMDQFTVTLDVDSDKISFRKWPLSEGFLKHRLGELCGAGQSKLDGTRYLYMVDKVRYAENITYIADTSQERSLKGAFDQKATTSSQLFRATTGDNSTCAENGPDADGSIEGNQFVSYLSTWRFHTPVLLEYDTKELYVKKFNASHCVISTSRHDNYSYVTIINDAINFTEHGLSPIETTAKFWEPLEIIKLLRFINFVSGLLLLLSYCVLGTLLSALQDMIFDFEKDGKSMHGEWVEDHPDSPWYFSTKLRFARQIDIGSVMTEDEECPFRPLKHEGKLVVIKMESKELERWFPHEDQMLEIQVYWRKFILWMHNLLCTKKIQRTIYVEKQAGRSGSLNAFALKEDNALRLLQLLSTDLEFRKTHSKIKPLLVVTGLFAGKDVNLVETRKKIIPAEPVKQLAVSYHMIKRWIKWENEDNKNHFYLSSLPDSTPDDRSNSNSRTPPVSQNGSLSSPPPSATNTTGSVSLIGQILATRSPSPLTNPVPGPQAQHVGAENLPEREALGKMDGSSMETEDKTHVHGKNGEKLMAISQGGCGDSENDESSPSAKDISAYKLKMACLQHKTGESDSSYGRIYNVGSSIDRDSDHSSISQPTILVSHNEDNDDNDDLSLKEQDLELLEQRGSFDVKPTSADQSIKQEKLSADYGQQSLDKKLLGKLKNIYPEQQNLAELQDLIDQPLMTRAQPIEADHTSKVKGQTYTVPAAESPGTLKVQQVKSGEKSYPSEFAQLSAMATAEQKALSVEIKDKLENISGEVKRISQHLVTSVDHHQSQSCCSTHSELPPPYEP